MTMENDIPYECPECGNVQNLPLYWSIDAQMSPNIKEELLEGKINRFCCTGC